MLLTRGNLNASHELSPALFCLSGNPPISCSSQQPPAYPSAAFPACSCSSAHQRPAQPQQVCLGYTNLRAVNSQSTALKVKMRTEAAGRSFFIQGACRGSPPVQHMGACTGAHGTRAAHPNELIF